MMRMRLIVSHFLFFLFFISFSGGVNLIVSYAEIKRNPGLLDIILKGGEK